MVTADRGGDRPCLPPLMTACEARQARPPRSSSPDSPRCRSTP